MPAVSLLPTGAATDLGTAAAAGFAGSGAPHIPQKRFVSPFSVPHRPQRNLPPDEGLLID